MAGDWIKMTHALPEKPEVLAIAGKTGTNRLQVVGQLFVLWRWFDNHTTDGNAPGVTSVTLEECLFGAGGNGGFVAAVVSVGWLIESEHGISVAKFDAHTSESAKERAQTAKRVAKSKKKGKGNAEGNGASVTSTVTETVPREEKRREENKEPTPTGVGRATRKCPSSFVVTDELRAWAAEKVPDIDTEAETETFRDHTFKTAVTDWPGTWRNWMRKAAQFGQKPSRPQHAQNGETAWQRSQRERVAQMTGGLLSAKAPTDTIDMETRNVTPLRVG